MHHISRILIQISIQVLLALSNSCLFIGNNKVFDLRTSKYVSYGTWPHNFLLYDLKNKLIVIRNLSFQMCL